MNDVLKPNMALVHLTARNTDDLQAKMQAAGAKQVLSLTYTGKHTAYVLVEKKAAAEAKPEAKPVEAKPEAASEPDKDDKSTTRRRG